MIESITIPDAAALCGVGEPAIRRAYHEGRIKWVCLIWIGKQTTIFLELNSVKKCYGIETDKRLQEMHTLTIRHPNGPEFLLYLSQPILLYNPYLEG